MNTTHTPESEPRSPQPDRGWWRWLGLRRREARWPPVWPTAWGWCVIVLVVFVVGTVSFAEYSMQPEFCRSCHIMEPYYKAWHESTHRDVVCGDCHFEPGWRNTLKGKFEASAQVAKYVTRTYGSKPHAEVRDASCLRSGCHERRLLDGRVSWDITSQRGRTITISFDHGPHLQELRRGKRLRCVSCHSQIVQGQHLVVTLDSCFNCHFKGLKHGRDEEVLGGCRSCHDAPLKPVQLATGVFDHKEYVDRGVTCENCHADSIKGDGAVPKQLCWTCHNEPHQLARFGETEFIHKNHVTDHKVECSNCHIQIEHHLTASHASEDQPWTNSGICGQCHEQTHLGPAELYRGVGGRGVPDMPSPMSRAQVDCNACHKKRQRPSDVAAVVGQTFQAVQDSCDYCHGNRYEGALEAWHKTINERLDRTEAAYLESKELLKVADLSPLDRLKIERLLDDADHNIRFVRLGHGVHNVTYATAVLNVALDKCTEALGRLRGEIPVTGNKAAGLVP